MEQIFDSISLILEIDWRQFWIFHTLRPITNRNIRNKTLTTVTRWDILYKTNMHATNTLKLGDIDKITESDWLITFYFQQFCGAPQIFHLLFFFHLIHIKCGNTEIGLIYAILLLRIARLHFSSHIFNTHHFQADYIIVLNFLFLFHSTVFPLVFIDLNFFYCSSNFLKLILLKLKWNIFQKCIKSISIIFLQLN